MFPPQPPSAFIETWDSQRMHTLVALRWSHFHKPGYFSTPNLLPCIGIGIVCPLPPPTYRLSSLQTRKARGKSMPVCSQFTFTQLFCYSCRIPPPASWRTGVHRLVPCNCYYTNEYYTSTKSHVGEIKAHRACNRRVLTPCFTSLLAQLSAFSALV